MASFLPYLKIENQAVTGKSSEKAASLQMTGLYKAQETENGHICRSDHAVYKVTAAA